MGHFWDVGWVELSTRARVRGIVRVLFGWVIILVVTKRVQFFMMHVNNVVPPFPFYSKYIAPNSYQITATTRVINAGQQMQGFGR